MPRATLEFDLPDEREEFEETCKAAYMASAIAEFSMLLRNKVKYGNGEKVSWEDVRALWLDITDGLRQ